MIQQWTDSAAWPLRSANLASEIEQGTIEVRVGSRRAGQTMEIESQLEATLVVMSREPSSNPCCGAVQKDLATTESERQDSGTHSVTHAGKHSERHIVLWHDSAEVDYENMGDVDERLCTVLDPNLGELVLRVVQCDERRRIGR